LGIGDWGLGIGDWPIPNPQSPIPNPHPNFFKKISIRNNFKKINLYKFKYNKILILKFKSLITNKN
jgi:hypothetical protein